MIRRLLAIAATAAVALTLTACQDPPGQEGVTQLRWATSAVGSAGHRAKVSLMVVLNREMPDYNIRVMPTSSALASIRGYSLGQFEGFYGANIAFHELAQDSGRFRGFAARAEHEPVQSFWAYTMEVGIAVRAREHASFEGWSDLRGRPLFTGPAAWDVRAQLDRALGILDVDYRYRELDLGLAGSALAQGNIDGFAAYTAGEAAPAAWVAEAELATDITLLSPSADEVARLRDAGLEVIELPAGVYRSQAVGTPIHVIPFFYGFHVGTEVPAEDVYRMLRIIEQHTRELATADAVFAQLAADMPGLQARGVAASVNDARVHPGLARYLREHGVWNSAWDERIAQ